MNAQFMSACNHGLCYVAVFHLKATFHLKGFIGTYPRARPSGSSAKAQTPKHRTRNQRFVFTHAGRKRKKYKTSEPMASKRCFLRPLLTGHGLCFEAASQSRGRCLTGGVRQENTSKECPFIWVWIKLKQLGLPGFSLGFHLPRCHFGTCFKPEPFADSWRGAHRFRTSPLDMPCSCESAFLWARCMLPIPGACHSESRLYLSPRMERE